MSDDEIVAWARHDEHRVAAMVEILGHWRSSWRLLLRLGVGSEYTSDDLVGIELEAHDALDSVTYRDLMEAFNELRSAPEEAVIHTLAFGELIGECRQQIDMTSMDAGVQPIERQKIHHWHGPSFHLRSPRNFGRSDRAYDPVEGAYIVPDLARADRMYNAFLAKDVDLPIPTDDASTPGLHAVPRILKSARVSRLVNYVIEGGPTWKIFVGDQERRWNQAIAATSDGALPIAVMITQGVVPEADHFNIAAEVEFARPILEERDNAAFIRRQVIWTYGGINMGWNDPGMSRLLGNLRLSPSGDPQTMDEAEFNPIMESKLHDLMRRSQNHGGEVFQTIFAYRPYPRVGVDRSCGFARNLPRGGGSHKLIDFAVNLLAQDLQSARIADAALKGGFWADEIHVKQMTHDLERAIAGRDEANPDMAEASRMARGSWMRLNQVPVGYWLDGPTIQDLRTPEQIQRGDPHRCRVKGYQNGDRDQTPHAITANWCDLMLEDTFKTWPTSKGRILGFPLVTPLPRSTYSSAPVADQASASSEDFAGGGGVCLSARAFVDRILRAPEDLQLLLTTDRNQMLEIDRSDRKFGLFVDQDAAVMSGGEIQSIMGRMTPEARGTFRDEMIDVIQRHVAGLPWSEGIAPDTLRRWITSVMNEESTAAGESIRDPDWTAAYQS